MIRLIYISTARSELSTVELEGILRISRRNNAAVGVTGLLIVGGRRFLQALEGPADAVVQTYDRIKAEAPLDAKADAGSCLGALRRSGFVRQDDLWRLPHQLWFDPKRVRSHSSVRTDGVLVPRSRSLT